MCMITNDSLNLILSLPWGCLTAMRDSDCHAPHPMQPCHEYSLLAMPTSPATCRRTRPSPTPFTDVCHHVGKCAVCSSSSPDHCSAAVYATRSARVLSRASKGSLRPSGGLLGIHHLQHRFYRGGGLLCTVLRTMACTGEHGGVCRA